MSAIILTNDFSVNRDEGIEIATKTNLPIETEFQPMGPKAKKYWALNRKNFEKLGLCADYIYKIPASSSEIERVFSRISNQIGHNSNRTKSETLVIINQSNNTSDQFIKKLKQYCTK